MTLRLAASAIAISAASVAAIPDNPCEVPSPWFGDVRIVPGAQGPIPISPIASADVNGDGLIDYFADGIVGSVYYVDGKPACCFPEVMESVLSWSVLRNVQGQAVHEWCTVPWNSGTRSAVETALATRFASIRDASALSTGWRDCDLDRDLDLVVHVHIVFMDGTQATVPLYFENIGFEYASGLASDINGDGSVDGKDLATVLAQWTGS